MWGRCACLILLLVARNIARHIHSFTLFLNTIKSSLGATEIAGREKLCISATGRDPKQRDRTEFHNVGTNNFPPSRALNIRWIKLKSPVGNNVIILIMCQQILFLSLISMWRKHFAGRALNPFLITWSRFENPHARHSGNIIYSYMSIRLVYSIHILLQLVIIWNSAFPWRSQPPSWLGAWLTMKRATLQQVCTS